MTRKNNGDVELAIDNLAGGSKHGGKYIKSLYDNLGSCKAVSEYLTNKQNVPCSIWAITCYMKKCGVEKGKYGGRK